MSPTYLIFERHEGKPFIIHRLTDPDKHWYWQVGSLNAFRNRSLNRSVKKITLPNGDKAYQGVAAPLSFEIEFEHIHQERLAYGSFLSNAWKDIPIQEHGTVFDFYRAVGIDWKKDKWPTLEQRRQQHDAGKS